jgi:hypothetical protein
MARWISAERSRGYRYPSCEVLERTVALAETHPCQLLTGASLDTKRFRFSMRHMDLDDLLKKQCKKHVFSQGHRPSPDARRVLTPAVPTASAGRVCLFGGEAQAIDESPWKKPPNAANTGTAVGTGLQPLPAQAMLRLNSVERIPYKDVNRARYLQSYSRWRIAGA